MEPVDAIQQIMKEYIRQAKRHPRAATPLHGACFVQHMAGALLLEASTVEAKNWRALSEAHRFFLRDAAIATGAAALRFLAELPTE